SVFLYIYVSVLFLLCVCVRVCVWVCVCVCVRTYVCVCEGQRRSPHILGCGLTGVGGEVRKNTGGAGDGGSYKIDLFIYTGDSLHQRPKQVHKINKHQSKTHRVLKVLTK